MECVDEGEEKQCCRTVETHTHTNTYMFNGKSDEKESSTNKSNTKNMSTSNECKQSKVYQCFMHVAPG